jgi:hypothetical protein
MLDNDDTLHASYSKHLSLGDAIKGLTKYAKDKGVGAPVVWSHNGSYAMRFTGRDGETRQMVIGKKYNDARRTILSLSAKPKPKATPATKSLSVRPGEKGKIKPYVSRVKGVWEVINADGKTVFKSKDKDEALTWWKKNYTRMIDGNMSLADPLSKGFQKGAKVQADGKPGKVTAIGLSSTGKRLAVIQFDDGTKKGYLQSKLKALSLADNSMAGEIAKLKKKFPKFAFSVTPSGQIKGRSDTKIVTGKDANEIIKKLGVKLSLAADPGIAKLQARAVAVGLKTARVNFDGKNYRMNYGGKAYNLGPSVGDAMTKIGKVKPK